jgi:hypothetical protein
MTPIHGGTCRCGQKPVPVTPTFSVPGGGAQRSVVALFVPTFIAKAAVTMVFHVGAAVAGKVIMTGDGGNPFAHAHTLHPVIDGPSLFIAPTADGGAVVEIDGTGGHTHGPGASVISHVWADIGSGAVISKQQSLSCFYPFGGYTLELTITDNFRESDSTTRIIVVAPDTKVPGECVSWAVDPG